MAKRPFTKEEIASGKHTPEEVEARRQEYNKYMREYMLKRYHTKRGECIQRLGGQCNNCGSKERLELDHSDFRSKELEMADVMLWAKERLEAELAKCQVLCEKCHQEKSIGEKGHEVVKGTDRHGTLSMYRYCKCDLCRAAKAEYSRNYKKKKQTGP